MNRPLLDLSASPQVTIVYGLILEVCNIYYLYGSSKARRRGKKSARIFRDFSLIFVSFRSIIRPHATGSYISNITHSHNCIPQLAPFTRAKQASPREKIFRINNVGCNALLINID